ncbi:MAG: hypothetical protein EPO57_09545, partial [Chitinophagaceae bacterium]
MPRARRRAAARRRCLDHAADHQRQHQCRDDHDRRESRRTDPHHRMSAAAAYDFQHIAVERPAPGVVLLTLNRPERMNATNDVLHSELVRLPAAIDADPGARAAVVTGAGRAFCVGGDWADIAGQGNDYANKIRMMRETSQILTGLIEMRKPLVSAINGPAAGIGLALGLLADISVANEEANLSDGHLRIGLAAGDHAAMVWPLLCSMAKAKRYLL